MTKISHNPLKPYIKADILQEFWATLGELQTKNINLFLKDILSSTEILMIAKRLAIIRALRENIDYATIRREYKVTDTTIAKMNNILGKADDSFLKVLDFLIKRENKRWEEFKERRKNAGGYKGGKLVFHLAR